jgi:nucleoside-triphosphatase
VSSDPLKILLEGPPRIGKSTIVSRLVELLRQAGQPVGGFITRELREDGHRVGFCVQDLVGPEAVLARQTLRTDVRVGRFYVDVAAFENVALPALASAARLRGVIVVDEIGRMELASSAFVDEVERLLDRPVPLVATIHVHEHTVTDRIKRRVDVELIEVTRDNRDDLPVELFRRFDVR